MATAKKPPSKTAKKAARQTPEPQELLLTELREIYNAENQLSRVLPRLTKALESDTVRQMFERRQEEGQRLIEELDRAFEEMDATPGRKKNPVAEGLIADAQEHVQEIEKGPALDAVLIGAMQKTEHYCIASWGTAKAFAGALNADTVVEAMQSALDEGKSFDDELTRIAVEEINPAMLSGGEEDPNDADEEEDEDEVRPTTRARGRSESEKRT